MGGLLPAPWKAKLAATVTIDMDSTDVEVYGSRKQGVAQSLAQMAAATRANCTHLGGAVAFGPDLADQVRDGG